MKNGKKKRVTTALRQEWLRCYEQGDTPREIAKSAGVDPRTVRKQIGLAQQDRELIEARTYVLRNALERHYEDLCKFATELKAVFYMPTSFGSAPVGLNEYYQQNPLLAALREHLPRSPLWKHIAAWDEARQAYATSVQALTERIRHEVAASGLFSKATGIPDMDRLYEAVEDDFGYHMLALLRGERGLRGAGGRGKGAGLEFRRNELLHLPEDKQAWLSEFMIEAQEWQEYQALTQAVKRLDQARKEVSLEADTLALRRVVAGRCRYCPF